MALSLYPISGDSPFKKDSDGSAFCPKLLDLRNVLGLVPATSYRSPTVVLQLYAPTNSEFCGAKFSMLARCCWRLLNVIMKNFIEPIHLRSGSPVILYPLPIPLPRSPSKVSGAGIVCMNNLLAFLWDHGTMPFSLVDGCLSI